jgi:hypothetical protein
MAGVTGRTVKMAFAKYATNSWTVATSVTKGGYFQTDDGMVHQPEIIEDRSMGQVYIGTTDRGNTNPVEPNFQAQSRYDDNNYLLEALAMGSPNAVTFSTSATGQVTSWLHVIDLADVIDGLGATFASDLGNYVKEIPSAKITGFTEAVSANESVQMETFYTLGVDAGVQSSININSTVAGASFPALANRIQKKHGAFRMNKQSAGSLGASDTLANVDSLQFEYRRGFDRSYSLGSGYLVEPAENDFPTFRLTATFNRMTTLSANSLRAALPLGTVFKGDWTSTGQLINSTDAFTKKYEFPHLEVTAFVDTVAGPAQVKPQVTFNIYKPSSAPTGMSWGTRPFRLTRIMTNSLIAF